jgi:Putative Flp pilus-assembly TadE/G-like
MVRSRIPDAGEARRGMVAAQVSLGLTALLGMLALLVDGGLLLSERRHAQATADAAALAAATDLYANWRTNQGADFGGTAAASALNVASSNGYTNDGTTNGVTVNIPPKSGNFISRAGYAEVIVTWNLKRGLSAIFGKGTIPVSARAVAQGRSVTGGAASPAILLLGAGPIITDITGNGSPSSVSVTVPSGTTGSGGSIYLDSQTNPATLSGSNSSVTAPYVYIAQSGTAPSGVTASASMVTGAPQLPDPLSYLPTPSEDNAGTGIRVDTTFAKSGITGSVILIPNTIYVVGGKGISLSGWSSVTVLGNGEYGGVMIYLTGANAAISLSGQSSVNLFALSTGPYAGMSIFQDRSDSTGWSVSGNGTLNTTGTIYAPAANVIASGNGGTVAYQIIASSMTVNGTGNVVAYSTTAGKIAATRSFGLVE